MEAVANVVLNRVKTAKRKGGYWWGNDIISVCRKPYQFSCWNKNDPNYNIITKVKLDNRKFRICMEIAEDAVMGDLLDNTKGADHYHATYVSPYWADDEEPTVKIGDHIFYKLGD
jgi:spore germination cell wall hydrolase CwlJ-like protein